MITTSVAIPGIPAPVFAKGDHVLEKGHGWYGGTVIKVRFGEARVRFECGNKIWTDTDNLKLDTHGYVANGFKTPQEVERLKHVIPGLTGTGS